MHMRIVQLNVIIGNIVTDINSGFLVLFGKATQKENAHRTVTHNRYSKHRAYIGFVVYVLKPKKYLKSGLRYQIVILNPKIYKNSNLIFFIFR